MTFQILSLLQRMNNTRADMFHDLVCEHRKLSDAQSKLLLELRQKGKLIRHICQMPCLLFSSCLFCRHTLIRRHISFYCYSAAGAEAQVTELVKRVKELTGMPDPAVTPIDTLYFKSFISCHCFLSSHYFDFKSFQMTKLHWRHATRTVRPHWMWPSNWTTGMPLTRSRWSS
jgi:hypothetical protein